MILGLGTDIIEVQRIKQAYLRHGERFVHRILTLEEREQCRKDELIPFIAKRFAAKEAFAKALGLGISSFMSWQAISILRSEKGSPKVVIHSTALNQQLMKMAVENIHVSLSDEKRYAIAFVILEAHKK